MDCLFPKNTQQCFFFVVQLNDGGALQAEAEHKHMHVLVWAGMPGLHGSPGSRGWLGSHRQQRSFGWGRLWLSGGCLACIVSQAQGRISKSGIFKIYPKRGMMHLLANCTPS